MSDAGSKAPRSSARYRAPRMSFADQTIRDRQPEEWPVFRIDVVELESACSLHRRVLHAFAVRVSLAHVVLNRWARWWFLRIAQRDTKLDTAHETLALMVDVGGFTTAPFACLMTRYDLQEPSCGTDDLNGFRELYLHRLCRGAVFQA